MDGLGPDVDDGNARVTIDLHVHSEESYDGKEPVELILEHAADIGLDGVVVTDHDEISESIRAAELAPEYGLIGVPGVEVSTAHGHLLAIGVEKKPPKGKPLTDTVAHVRELGGAAVVPHPFQVTRHGVRKKRIQDCDGIEVYNAWLFTGYRNRRSNAFARKNGYSRIGASDAHSITMVGRAYTEILFEDRRKNRVNAEDVVAAIKRGETEIHGRRVPVLRSAYHYLKASVRKTAWGIRSGASKIRGVRR